MHHRKVRLVLAVALVAGSLTASAGIAAAKVKVAKAPVPVASPWYEASPASTSNLTFTPLLRTANGVLHYAYPNSPGLTTTDLDSNVLGALGKPGPSPATIVSGWDGTTFPGLVQNADGSVDAFFSGLRDTTTGDTYTSGAVYEATSDQSTTAWTLQPGDFSMSSSAYASADVNAAVLNGTPLYAFSGTGFLYLHSGLGAAGTETNLDSNGSCCFYYQHVVADPATGTAWAAWYSNSTTAPFHVGQYIQQVAPTMGAPIALPGSANATGTDSFLPVDVPTALAARTGGGVYTAYCLYSASSTACDHAVIYRADTGASLHISTPGAKQLFLANGGGGRLWFGWIGPNDSGNAINVARTNATVTALGATATLAPPAHGESVYRIDGEGSLGPLDLFSYSSTSASGAQNALWDTEISPTLTLTASKAKQTVTLHVLDAGAPVGGAAVVLAGQHATTSAKGVVTFTFSTKVTGKFYATATKSGYRLASTLVKL